MDLLMKDYQKVTKVRYKTSEKIHAKAKLNQLQKLERLIQQQFKHHGLCPQGLDRWVVNFTDQFLTPARMWYNWCYALHQLLLEFPWTLTAVEDGVKKLRNVDAKV